MIACPVVGPHLSREWTCHDKVDPDGTTEVSDRDCAIDEARIEILGVMVLEPRIQLLLTEFVGRLELVKREVPRSLVGKLRSGTSDEEVIPRLHVVADVVGHPQRKEPVPRTGPAVANSGEEESVVPRQLEAPLGLEPFHLLAGQRSAHEEVVPVRAENVVVLVARC